MTSIEEIRKQFMITQEMEGDVIPENLHEKYIEYLELMITTHISNFEKLIKPFEDWKDNLLG